VTDHCRRTLLFGIGTSCLAASAGLAGLLAGTRPAQAQALRSAATEIFSGQTHNGQPRAAQPMPDLTRAHGVVNLSHVETRRSEVALTFDDGPHPEHTPRLLDILAEHRVRATFYVIGTMVRRYPAIVQRIVAEGHELGNHTWNHPTLSQHGDARILSEIDRTQEVIWQTVGQLPVTFRPPYGAMSPRQSRMLHERRNLPSVNWSVDPQDWQRPGASVVARRMIEGARPGAIILAHDIHGPTVRAVPEAIAGLQARGFRCVTMSELLGWGLWGPTAPRTRFVARPFQDFAG